MVCKQAPSGQTIEFWKRAVRGQGGVVKAENAKVESAKVAFDTA